MSGVCIESGCRERVERKPTGRAPLRCPAHREAHRRAKRRESQALERARRSGLAPAIPEALCVDCGVPVGRPGGGGRQPERCPEHRAARKAEIRRREVERRKAARAEVRGDDPAPTCVDCGARVPKPRSGETPQRCRPCQSKVAAARRVERRRERRVEEAAQREARRRARQGPCTVCGTALEPPPTGPYRKFCQPCTDERQRAKRLGTWQRKTPRLCRTEGCATSIAGEGRGTRYCAACRTRRAEAEAARRAQPTKAVKAAAPARKAVRKVRTGPKPGGGRTMDTARQEPRAKAPAVAKARPAKALQPPLPPTDEAERAPAQHRHPPPRRTPPAGGVARRPGRPRRRDDGARARPGQRRPGREARVAGGRLKARGRGRRSERGPTGATRREQGKNRPGGAGPRRAPIGHGREDGMNVNGNGAEQAVEAQRTIVGLATKLTDAEGRAAALEAENARLRNAGGRPEMGGSMAHRVHSAMEAQKAIDTACADLKGELHAIRRDLGLEDGNTGSRSGDHLEVSVSDPGASRPDRMWWGGRYEATHGIDKGLAFREVAFFLEDGSYGVEYLGIRLDDVVLEQNGDGTWGGDHKALQPAATDLARRLRTCSMTLSAEV